MYDAVIIGGGVTGCAVARYLSRYRVKACVIEREEDVCDGTSKANSAIVHAGYDAVPGSKKAKYNVRGSEMMEALSKALDFPYKRIGSLVVAGKDHDESLLVRLMDQGEKNGVKGLEILDRAKVLSMEPNLSDEVDRALYAPSAAIVCPFNLTIALAENAADNGVEFFLNTSVESVEKEDGHYLIRVGHRAPAYKEKDSEIPPSVLETKTVINAAGVYADAINNMVSAHKYHITPRRGQYELLDRTAGDHVKHTIFQLPTKMGKGVLVTPTVHGNLLVGPTAEDIGDKEDVRTTADGLSYLSKTASHSVKDIPFREVITSFAGLRAHEDGGDFVIGEAEDAPGFFNALGIESPGLSSAPAIGEDIAALVAGYLDLEEDPDFKGKRTGIPDPSKLTLEERNVLIREDPSFGQIICRCEMVTEGEIKNSIRRTLGARSLDGVKRRTRAGMGRCQAGFCSPRTMEILEREVPMTPFAVTKTGGDSRLVVGRNKDLERGLS